MARIDNILRNQPKEIAKQVTQALDKRELLKETSKPVYDGDLSWRKLTPHHGQNLALKYQPLEKGLDTFMYNFNKKLNVI